MSLSLAENIIVARADNRPPMLDKSNYSSWASLDITTTNIVLHGLPQGIYNLVNHNEHAKQIWDRVKLHIQGSELSLQERESKLYDDFDMFTSTPGETIHSCYMRFAQLINDMHTIRMKMRPMQVNTKFANHLQPEWSKFFTDVKLAKDMHSTNFDQLYAYLRQHEAHANEVRLTRQRYPGQIALTDDLDAFDSDYDDAPSAKAVLMANLSSYDLDVLSEVPFHDTHIENDMSYQETKTPVVQSTSSPAQQDALIISVIEEMSSQVAKCNKVQQENMVVNETLTAELKRYK
ncbi:hypothetical protein Tco_0268662 [Tanacetum coccineum]